MSFSVHRIGGLAYELGRRDVAFLKSDENSEINAWVAFEELEAKPKREILDRFDLWKRGDLHHKKYFHGFDEPNHRDCLVFKRQDDRFYGFWIHPRPRTDARYQLCILVNHAQKNEEHTDPAELNTVNRFKRQGDVIEAVQKEFPEKPGGPHGALHGRK
jgi:hypothetical protein